MIKIKTNYDYENDIFSIKQLKYKNSCTTEFLSLIHILMEEILLCDENMTKKEIYKILRDYDKGDIMEVIDNAH